MYNVLPVAGVTVNHCSSVLLLNVISYTAETPYVGQEVEFEQSDAPEIGPPPLGVGDGVGGTGVTVGVGFAITLLKKLNPFSGPANCAVLKLLVDPSTFIHKPTDVGEGVGTGVVLAVGTGVSLGVGNGVPAGVALGLGVGPAVTEGVGVGTGVAVGLGVAIAIAML